MVEVKKEGILLKKTDLVSENEGVLNPAPIREGDNVHLYYRAVSKGNYSSIGYCKLKGPLTIEDRFDHPILSPEEAYESNGVEDPRITKIDDLFYLSYTVYDGVNALGAVAVSTDFLHFQKKGIIVPQITYEDFRHLVESQGPVNKKYLRYNEQGQIEKKRGKAVLLWDKKCDFFSKTDRRPTTFPASDKARYTACCC